MDAIRRVLEEHRCDLVAVAKLVPEHKADGSIGFYVATEIRLNVKE